MGGVRGAIQVSETRERLFRATVESGRGCLLVNFLHWSADPTIALGRYMKACRASDPGHKATEEDLSNRDTLVWSYPKVRTILANKVIHLIHSQMRGLPAF